MSGVRTHGTVVLNSEYATNQVFAPFIESMVILVGAIVSFVLLKLLQKELLKRNIIFAGTKRCLKYFEIVVVLFAVIIAVYNKTIDFDCAQYGYDVDTIKAVITQESGAQYIPLEEIPHIESIGIKSAAEPSIQTFFYNFLSGMSDFMSYMWYKLELLIAIAGTILIPLKDYAERIEKKIKP